MRASVIIPTRGRPDTVRRAIQSMLETGVPRADAEVVIVDNNSDDAACTALRQYCEALGASLRYAREPSPGLGAARDCGARMARGDVLVFVDDDIEVSPAWLDALLGAFRDQAVGIAGGPSLPRFSASVPAWFWDFIIATPYGGWSCGWVSLLDVGRSVPEIDPDWIWGLNFAIRREVFERLGGMHPDVVPAGLQRWQGDGETGLTRKAKAAGVRAAYVQEAVVWHLLGADRLTPDYFCRRAFFQGVCDSFSAIRAGAAPSTSDPVPNTAPGLVQGLVGWTVEAGEVKARTVAAYAAGWQFHQQEAALDPRLLEWIRRTDYRDSDIRRELTSWHNGEQALPASR